MESYDSWKENTESEQALWEWAELVRPVVCRATPIEYAPYRYTVIEESCDEFGGYDSEYYNEHEARYYVMSRIAEAGFDASNYEFDILDGSPFMRVWHEGGRWAEDVKKW